MLTDEKDCYTKYSMKTKLVIFGITGDLSKRKLLPALSRVIATGGFDDLTIIGVSRRHVEEYQVLGDHNDQLNGTTSMFTMDLSNLAEYTRLRDYIDLKDDEQLLFYLSVPPDSSGEIVENLGNAGLNSPNVKLLLEKPFGFDMSSALEMISHTDKHFNESQVYRIDHYLAKEMAQNILTFRARNALFAHVWNNTVIERVEVIALEQIDIEGRAEFYEQTGALRDVLQGHLLQLLSLVLLPVPGDLDWGKMPECRLIALNYLQPADPSKSVRGQYNGYRDEVGNADSTVETFISAAFESSDPTWQGVPLALTTGKALDRKTTEIRIHFRKTNAAQSNFLIFRIQPNEGIEIVLVTKKPGYEDDLETHSLAFMYPEGTRLPDAYEQVLVDAIEGRKSLFASSSEVVRAWEIVAPLQEAWAKTSDDLRFYDRGSKAGSIIA
jgi:glucose-6-phosphate 1-dehydrogenase